MMHCSLYTDGHNVMANWCMRQLDKIDLFINDMRQNQIICQSFQEMLATLPFSQIMHWVSGPTFFHLTVGDSTAFSKLMLETSLAYKMDDLLTSYIAHVLASTDKQKQGQKK